MSKIYFVEVIQYEDTFTFIGTLKEIMSEIKNEETLYLKKHIRKTVNDLSHKIKDYKHTKNFNCIDFDLFIMLISKKSTKNKFNQYGENLKTKRAKQILSQRKSTVKFDDVLTIEDYVNINKKKMTVLEKLDKFLEELEQDL